MDQRIDDEFSKMEEDLESQRLEMEEQDKNDNHEHGSISNRICYDRFGDVPLLHGYHHQPHTNTILSHINMYNTMIQKQPDKPNNYVERAFLYLKLVDRENDSMFDLQRAISLHAEGPYFLRCILGIALVHFRTGKFHDALSVLESIVIPTFDHRDKETNIVYSYCLYFRGILHEMSHSFIKAIADFTPAIEIGKLTMALRERGFCFVSIGDLEPAMQDLDQVVEASEWEHIIDSDEEKFLRCYVYRSQISARSGNFEDALQDINKAINSEVASRNPGWFLYRGKYYQSMDQYDLAILDFTHVIESIASGRFRDKLMELPLIQAIRLRGETFYANKQYDKSVKDGVIAVQTEPNNLKIYDWLVPSYYFLADYHGAASLIHKVLQTGNIKRATVKRLQDLFDDVKKKQEDIFQSLLHESPGAVGTSLAKKKSRKRRRKPKTKNEPEKSNKISSDGKSLLVSAEIVDIAPKPGTDSSKKKPPDNTKSSNDEESSTSKCKTNFDRSRKSSLSIKQEDDTEDSTSTDQPTSDEEEQSDVKIVHININDININTNNNTNNNTNVNTKLDTVHSSQNTTTTSSQPNFEKINHSPSPHTKKIDSYTIKITNHSTHSSSHTNHTNHSSHSNNPSNPSNPSSRKNSGSSQQKSTNLYTTDKKKEDPSTPNLPSPTKTTSNSTQPITTSSQVPTETTPSPSLVSEPKVVNPIPVPVSVPVTNTSTPTSPNTKHITSVSNTVSITDYSTHRSTTSGSIDSPKPNHIIEDLPNVEYKQVGKLKWALPDIIGRGSGGTLVYKGTFDSSTTCAIKILVKAYWPKYDTEIRNLLYICMEKDDLPPTVVRYYGKEEDNEKIYLALELCEQTLQQYMATKPAAFNISAKLLAMKDISSAVAFLHKYNIVHNDINPRNILLSKGKFKLADLGLSKWLNDEQSSYTFSGGGIPTGAGGWYAREILNGERKTRSVDIFALGCVYYYILSDGFNPYGDKFYSYVNIKEGNPPLLESLTYNQEHLITHMILHDPDERPDITNVMNHPTFWETRQIFEFLHNVSNVIDHEESSVKSQFEDLIKKNCERNWKACLDDILVRHISQHRPYVETNYIHLIRAIRNLREHWKDIQRNYTSVYDFFGGKIAGIWSYFDSKFPYLLINVWVAMNKLNLLSKLDED
eukprot:TRINITY_DN6676_c0_g2_i1.p1 TRINITY_DN6676_c0_g2~~TRINITY_DN6676_c0_g2_i1.p1  ORF type:complete len:1156 (-),score=245.20 TRINITY_DN6676_c0_g2_i1:525-3992(-)